MYDVYVFCCVISFVGSCLAFLLHKTEANGRDGGRIGGGKKRTKRTKGEGEGAPELGVALRSVDWRIGARNTYAFPPTSHNPYLPMCVVK